VQTGRRWWQLSATHELQLKHEREGVNVGLAAGALKKEVPLFLAWYHFIKN
jgi:hypothetical protein